MLDHLRAMAVFASVVRFGSFSEAAREFNVTTSAVSQQIRSLESDLGMVLLQRSTRKISLTEAGELFYRSATDMVTAAEIGWNQVACLRDEVFGNLTIATTTSAIGAYVMSALSDWLDDNKELSLRFVQKDKFCDLDYEPIDVMIGLTDRAPDDGVHQAKFGNVCQMLLASPKYLETQTLINGRDDLREHGFVALDDSPLLFADGKKINVASRVSTNDVNTALGLAVAGHGIVKANKLDATPFLERGELVPVLDEYALPSLYLVARLPNKEFQPAKVQRLLDVLAVRFATTSHA
ncbi:MAG: LysR family transcriptional regulator [Moraxella sp.]|uniref:LysR family transcriptional regulator n=1 Tax=Moraxella sp. TaxID=479 RepID=UPI0026DAA229|nr:LysR family transcriptional regulator [Moraxella sp.]MDO4449927.1 LysR family transcriptional regulator [Moraxella sp.]